MTRRIPLTSDDEQDDEPFVTARGQNNDDDVPTVVGGKEYVEREAVQLLVETLRDKGVSDRFIETHMDEIREKVRDELYGD